MAKLLNKLSRVKGVVLEIGPQLIMELVLYPTGLGLLPFTLKVLITNPSSPILTTVCIPSNSYLILDSTTLPEFDTVWNSCNGNFQRKPIPVAHFFNLLSQPDHDKCSDTFYHTTHCNILGIAERRNFTFASVKFNRDAHLFHIEECFKIYMDRFIHGDYYEVVYYPSTKIPFNFYIIIPKPRSLKGFQALIEPFPLETWLTVLFTCAIVGLLIYAAKCRQEVRFLRGTALLQDFWLIYSILVLQGSARVGPFVGKWGAKAIWTVGCFLLCAIIMTSLYQGELATAMTTVVFPFIPLNLEDLSKSAIPIVTAGSRDGSSNLATQISVANSLEIYGPKVSAYLGTIKDHIFLAQGRWSYTGFKLTLADKLRQLGGGKELIIKGRMFSVMDDAYKTRDMLEEIFLSPDFIVYPGREDLGVNEDFMWAWMRNFFTKIYERSWLRWIEGGLEKRFSQISIQSTSRHRAKSLGNDSREHLLRVLLNDWKKKEEADFSQSNQESMLPCYYFFLILISLTVMIFLVEVGRNVRNRVRRIQLGRAGLVNIGKCNFRLHPCRKYRSKNRPEHRRVRNRIIQ